MKGIHLDSVKQDQIKTDEINTKLTEEKDFQWHWRSQFANPEQLFERKTNASISFYYDCRVYELKFLIEIASNW